MTKKAPRLLNCAQLKVTVPKWVWYPYIPADAATLLFGVGGIGKSYMSIEIISALSAGRPLPGQSDTEVREHKVLLMSAEDSPSAVIKPRLIRCKANLKNIFIPAEPFTLDKWGLAVVKRYMEMSEASVVVIDPIVHYMGGKIDMNKMNEVRALTGALHQDAMAMESAILIIHHARKGGEGQQYEKAAGSADFVNATRSVLYACKAADGTSVMAHVKTNYAIYGKPLAYFIDKSGFHWIGHYDENMLNAKVSPKREQAKAFLIQVLKDGPVSSKELSQFAADEGFTMTTLNRAKTGTAESIMRYVGEKKQWYWRLKGSQTEPGGTTVDATKDEEKYAKDFDDAIER